MLGAQIPQLPEVSREALPRISALFFHTGHQQELLDNVGEGGQNGRQDGIHQERQESVPASDCPGPLHLEERRVVRQHQAEAAECPRQVHAQSRPGHSRWSPDNSDGNMCN